MLKNGTFHQDLGADFLVKRDRGRIDTKLANRLKDLGYDVTFTQRPEFAATLTSVSG
jgi:hypothetical protein